MRLEIVDDFPCEPDTLFALFTSEALATRVRESSSSRREDLAERMDGDVLVRSTRISPRRELPSMLTKLLGPAGLAYTQTDRFHAPTRTITWELDVERSQGRASITGTVRVLPAPAGCRRLVQAEVIVRLPLVGGRIEEHVGAEIRRTYARSAGLLRELLEAEGPRSDSMSP